MAQDSSNRSFVDIVGGPGGGSAFLRNGFASLDGQSQPEQDNKKNDGEDGLFVEDGNAPAGNGVSWESPISLEDNEDGKDSDQPGPSNPSNTVSGMAQHSSAH